MTRTPGRKPMDALRIDLTETVIRYRNWEKWFDSASYDADNVKAMHLRVLHLLDHCEGMLRLLEDVKDAERV